MNLKIAVVSAAAAVLGVACGNEEGPNAATVDELTSALSPSDAGGKWYGSDTLKTATVAAEGTGKAGTTLSYQGKGSGIGEACIRNGVGSTVGSTTYCATLANTAKAPYQVLAPMSRDLKASQGDGGACIGGGAANSSGCCPGERSNVVALDGVDVWVKGDNTSTNISLADLKALFCGNADGQADAGKYPTGCVTKFGDGGIEFTLGDGGFSEEVLELYVRNDSSGTTDAFQTLVGCKNSKAASEPYVYCPGIQQVTDSASGSVHPTIVTWDSTGKARAAVSATGCALGVDATTCIGKLVETDDHSIGYAGGSAADGTNNLALSVNGIKPSATTIRSLLTNATGTYPLARRLFLNENINYTADTQEAKYYNWIYGNPQAKTANNKLAYENVLVGKGFISCNTAGALECGFDGGVGVCFGYDGGTAINDGRGTGNCRAAPTSTDLDCVR